jgi:hypothetical protein
VVDSLYPAPAQPGANGAAPAVKVRRTASVRVREILEEQKRRAAGAAPEPLAPIPDPPAPPFGSWRPAPSDIPRHLAYEPDALDRQIRTYVAVCERSAVIAEHLAKKAEAAMEAVAKRPLRGGAKTMAEAKELTQLHERLSKANLNLVKAMDELSRLRSFLAGGPDSRPELTHKSEVELRALVLEIAPRLGFRLVEDGAGPVAESPGAEPNGASPRGATLDAAAPDGADADGDWAAPDGHTPDGGEGSA